jgi:ubiquinone/menaquinone biosynthesis C-methylase UbiE
MESLRKYRASSDRFDKWSDTYENSFTWRHFFDPIHRLIAGELGDLSGERIVDVGCGTGGLLRRLAADGEASGLVGIDESEGMLEVARERGRDIGRLEFVRASAERLPLDDGSFDTAVTCIAFHHFPDPVGALNEMHRVLRPEGRLYLCDMSGEGMMARLFLLYGKTCATDTRYFDRRTLEELLSVSGFSVMGSRVVNRFPPALLVTATRP